VLDEMQHLAHEIGAGVLLITHDLALALERADRIVVMHDGRIVESGTAQRLSTAPQTDYARRLLSAAPGMIAAPLITARPAAPQATPESGSAPGPEPLLELDGVRQTYRVRGRREPFVALAGISLAVPAGETVALVGESGSGKSTTARLALRLEDPAAGTIRFEGAEITGRRGSALLPFRRSVQPVFQNPYASLDPRRTIAETISEPLAVHRIGDGRSRRRRVAELLDRVAMPADTASRYPAELSGGQRQRVAIARALALEPRLVVMDEAVSALDVLVQEQILELMVSLQRDTGLSFLFISHDLAVVRLVSHYAYVLQHGHVVESGAPDELFRHPHHAYTQRLVDAIPGTRLREEA
jgi:peptide/nickel transport system ATP-binding protein